MKHRLKPRESARTTTFKASDKWALHLYSAENQPDQLHLLGNEGTNERSSSLRNLEVEDIIELHCLFEHFLRQCGEID